MKNKIEIVPYRQSWEADYQSEKKAIEILLPEQVAIYHIGSTSIPNMFAIPIIDLMLVVTSLSQFDEYSDVLKTLGYEQMGDESEEDRRFFIKCDENCSFHIQVFAKGNPIIERNIAFREYMIAHTDQAMEYISLKKELAKKFPENKTEYKKGRKKFLEVIDDKAGNWKK
ncbi:GrpB family protein [Gottfriedia luciferensis]|uniref:GrpB family protein n=1 Tax=Gottfriedia luciferensis TaxID=178774 RepID=UPI000B434FDD|nr:GrpB family protein [Gottfriedia luciferensis]